MPCGSAIPGVGVRPKGEATLEQPFLSHGKAGAASLMFRDRDVHVQVDLWLAQRGANLINAAGRELPMWINF